MTRAKPQAPKASSAALELILALTAFAAGSVDVIAFARLGGILASAMTGNLAFLAYYISRFSAASAIGSATALAGFITGSAMGTLLNHRKPSQRLALRFLLGAETSLLAGAAAVWFSGHHGAGSLHRESIIALLAIAMGLQSIIAKRINLSNIPTVVFTTTLTNIVIALTEMLASGTSALPKDTKRQCASFSLYFFGALCAGFGAYFNVWFLILIPLAAVTVAFGIELSQQG